MAAKNVCRPLIQRGAVQGDLAAGGRPISDQHLGKRRLPDALGPITPRPLPHCSISDMSRTTNLRSTGGTTLAFSTTRLVCGAGSGIRVQSFGGSTKTLPRRWRRVCSRDGSARRFPPHRSRRPTSARPGWASQSRRCRGWSTRFAHLDDRVVAQAFGLQHVPAIVVHSLHA